VGARGDRAQDLEHAARAALGRHAGQDHRRVRLLAGQDPATLDERLVVALDAHGVQEREPARGVGRAVVHRDVARRRGHRADVPGAGGVGRTEDQRDLDHDLAPGQARAREAHEQDEDVRADPGRAAVLEGDREPRLRAHVARAAGPPAAPGQPRGEQVVDADPGGSVAGAADRHVDHQGSPPRPPCWGGLSSSQ
jgi:hypothetical protein